MAKGEKGGRRTKTGKGKVSVGAASRDSEAALEDAAYAEAEKAIAEAQRSGATDLSLTNRYLSRIPPSTVGLTFLRILRLNDTAVTDLAPLAGLTGLQTLWLGKTRVTDLAPLAGLTALQTLWLDDAAVADLTPLAGHTALQTLWLSNTRVADIAPLSGLTALQNLWLIGTRVTDLAPLAKLSALQTLWLANTAVADLTPLAGLTALETLSLAGTAIADLAPLAGLTALEDLSLDNTAVIDLAPLARLTALQDLSLDNTAVTDLAPLARLTALQDLLLDNTAVTDLAPLAGLTALEALSLNNTAVADLTPLAGLNTLQSLWLNNTHVTDLTPLAGLRALQDLSLDRCTVADLAPLAALVSLCDAVASKVRHFEELGLSFIGSAVARLRPFDHLASMKNPARTVETINYLRRQQGLEEYWPKGYERPAEILEFWKGFEAEKQEDKIDEDNEQGDTDARALDQRPAPHVFTVVDGKILGRPYRGEYGDQQGPDQREIAADLHAALLEKLSDVLAPARAGRLQLPDRLTRTFERIERTLGKTVNDLREGWLVSASRTLAADISAYDTEAGRSELAEGVLAALIDLKETLPDLMACYPSISRIEAARIAQNLEPPHVEAAMRGMREIREAAEKAPEVVSESAKESLARDTDTIADLDRDAKNPGISQERQASAAGGRNYVVAYSLLTYRNFAAQVNKLAASATPSKETRKAVGDAARRAGAATADFGKKTADEINHYGPGQTGAVAVAGALGLLANAIAGPVAGLGVFLPTFRELSKRSAQKADDQAKKGAAQKPAKTTEPKSDPKPKTPKQPKT